MSYFSCDYDGNFELHNTAKEAKEAAEDWLHDCRDIASGDGWPESVGQICWGQIVEQVELVHTRKPTPREAKKGWSEVREYDLKYVELTAIDTIYVHACLTGDCPHGTANECLASLTDEINSLQARHGVFFNNERQE